ncbi:MAG: T9SS type A sorting domain-containing protein, partial [Elusimicrobia bacterium]|nr:T9SS type A sorting domain-containing protein [Elusimicrobiota bacterium]
VQRVGDTLEITISTGSTQDLQTTIANTSTRTLVLRLNLNSGELRTTIPVGAFSDLVKVRVRVPTSFPAATSAFRGAPATSDGGGTFDSVALGAPSVLSGFGIGLEITTDRDIKPVKPVTIAMEYRGSDISNTDPQTLVISRFEESAQKWMTLPTSINTSEKRATGTTRRFSKFQLMALAPASDVEQASVFPNPLRLHRGQTEMTFTNLSAHASIKIYTLLGELVRELTADATGTFRWDAKNSYGERVSSDVYLVLIEGANGSRKVLKVGVEK